MTCGNTYTVDKTKFDASGYFMEQLISAYVSVALQTNDKIYLTYNQAAYNHKMGSIFYLNNVASSNRVDQTADGPSYNTAVSISSDTITSATVIVGGIQAYGDTSHVYTPDGTWTTESYFDWADRAYFFHKDVTSNGTQDPAGSYNGNVGWSGIWVAYK